MFVERFKNNGKDYLRLAKSQRVLDAKAGRAPEVIYYDVTNFYFEIEEPDEDFTDEQRKLPIVQRGLFMDDHGIPIAVEPFPGNTLDHLTLRPALRKNIDGLDFSRFILVADRGIFQY